MVTTHISAAHWPGVALVLALATVCWPASACRARLGSVLPSGSGGMSGRRRPWAIGALSARYRTGPARYLAVALLATPGGALLGGPGGAVAAGLATALATRQWHAARMRRLRTGELTALLDAVAVMTTELRAGAHPAGAARVAAESAGGVGGPARWWPARDGGQSAVGRVLGAVAAGARLGAEVPALLARHALREPVIGAELGRLAAAWALADRHGVTLAELLDAVRADQESRVRLSGQISAQLAGPRSTAAVLAVLPVLGILLGQGIGAGPWRVLTATTPGQLLLVVGTVLTCAGVLWTGRITTGAVLR